MDLLKLIVFVLFPHEYLSHTKPNHFDFIKCQKHQPLLCTIHNTFSDKLNSLYSTFLLLLKKHPVELLSHINRADYLHTKREMVRTRCVFIFGLAFLLCKLSFTSMPCFFVFAPVHLYIKLFILYSLDELTTNQQLHICI